MSSVYIIAICHQSDIQASASICHHDMSSSYVIMICHRHMSSLCHRDMSSPYAIMICHRHMSSPYVIIICHHHLSSVHVIVVCHRRITPSCVINTFMHVIAQTRPREMVQGPRFLFSLDPIGGMFLRPDGRTTTRDRRSPV